ncbi:hypothetical protein GGE07_005714 [Sinorhizobium terangae]|nr:hypothetical protein [Sinorhizobium terangae]
MKCNINRLNEEQEARSSYICRGLYKTDNGGGLGAFPTHSGQESVNLTSASAALARFQVRVAPTNPAQRDFFEPVETRLIATVATQESSGAIEVVQL